MDTGRHIQQVIEKYWKGPWKMTFKDNKREYTNDAVLEFDQAKWDALPPKEKMTVWNGITGDLDSYYGIYAESHGMENKIRIQSQEFYNQGLRTLKGRGRRSSEQNMSDRVAGNFTAAAWAEKLVDNIEEALYNLEMEVGQPLDMNYPREWAKAWSYVGKIEGSLKGLRQIMKRVDI